MRHRALNSHGHLVEVGSVIDDNNNDKNTNGDKNTSSDKSNLQKQRCVSSAKLSTATWTAQERPMEGKTW